ncbi:DUF485 domain-containing protein [Caballeronia sp. 15711]|uniref:DUF485 domain-containing protein n=1 Tax=Caballeronia sp. 15711 TaxID=3391029 RepID=UPI0039E4452B
MVDSNAVERIMQQTLFRELVKRRSRLVWALMAVSLAAYFILTTVAAFWPALLSAPVAPGAMTTTGIVLATFAILLGWILTWVYVRQANGNLERLSDRLLEEVDK